MNRSLLENIPINRQEGEEQRKNLDLALAYDKAARLLDEERIDPKQFKGLYSDEMMREHSDYVAKRQQDFRAKKETPEQIEMQRYAMVFEAIIHDQIDMNGWAGLYASAKKASWYDDIKNGVDEIIEFEQTEYSPTAHLALAVDVTFTKDIFEKMEKIKTKIDQGEAGVIKYLLTDTYRGEMRNVPKVIVGADLKSLNEIIKLWVDKALLHKYYLKARSACDRYNLRYIAIRHSQGCHFV